MSLISVLLEEQEITVDLSSGPQVVQITQGLLSTGGTTTIQFPVEEDGVQESATVQRLNFTGNVNVTVASNEATIDVPAGSGGDLLAANNLSDLDDAATARTNLGLGTAATQASSAFQPADSDLTAIAALTTTAYGRGLLELANQAALQSAVGVTQYTDEMARDALGTALVAGTGITITPNDGADTITIAATGGGGGAWSLQGGPLDNEAPASNYATLDTRNSHPTLDFDTTTQEGAVWTRALPPDYAGGGITVSIWVAATSATSGTIGFDVAIERIDASSLDIDADSFATAQTVTATTVPGTSGQVLKLSVNISNGANMDSLAAGELFRLRIRRDVTNDTAAGDAELLRWLMVEQ